MRTILTSLYKRATSPTLQKQFHEYRVSTAKELNAAVTAAKTGSGDVLKGISKRLGEKEAQMNVLNMALDRAGLCQEHQGLLRFSGEWQTFVEGLLRMPDGQTTVPLEQYPLDPCSLLRFLQNTHKTYLSTVRHLQEKCTAAEKERDELRVLLANSQMFFQLLMASFSFIDYISIPIHEYVPGESLLLVVSRFILKESHS
ncbi:hypothetical protein PC9H_008740 [Pleurotus ostreatus]|uniref:Uncharacterized protein n=2 Tax=Pleurotus TaxID=5320 RepID=A0A8H6ZSC1_PLEOS|nr:uncharacterized protein PC9H_008740 [Pleurotus ostreatus]KAF7426372.1 hypothetical protein PC9H_008740 [Pleurotus ostreatus]KAG9221881.1 hypothetical protein CCMSSC00406_0005706 [Pleurotus cornucopiae]